MRRRRGCLGRRCRFGGLAAGRSRRSAASRFSGRRSFGVGVRDWGRRGRRFWFAGRRGRGTRRLCLVAIGIVAGVRTGTVGRTSTTAATGWASTFAHAVLGEKVIRIRFVRAVRGRCFTVFGLYPELAGRTTPSGIARERQCARCNAINDGSTSTRRAVGIVGARIPHARSNDAGATARLSTSGPGAPPWCGRIP